MNHIKRSLLSFAPDVFRGFPVLFAYLYGSYATGVIHPFSDLDVGVFLSPDTIERSMRTESDIALALDAALGNKVETDVRAINSAPLLMKGEIVTEGLLLYSRDDASRVEFETRVRMAYFDFLPVLKAYHKSFVARVLSYTPEKEETNGEH